jgi:hypothetical protein
MAADTFTIIDDKAVVLSGFHSIQVVGLSGHQY